MSFYDPDDYLDEPEEDLASLEEEFEERASWAASVMAAATALREQAASVVEDQARQGEHRSGLGIALARQSAKLSTLAGDVPAKNPYRLHTAVAMGRPESSSKETELQASQVWPAILATRKALEASAAKDRSVVADAHAAADQAAGTADAAIRYNARVFPPPRVRPSLPTPLARAPFAAFLLVAALGIPLSPATEVSLVLGSILVLAAAVPVVVSARRGSSSAGDMLALGAGSSLAVFSALYMACSFVQPSSITESSGSAIASVAECSLLALSVGATAGPIGLSLDGPARVVAFIQLLFTIAAVSAALAVAWRQILASRDQLPPAQG